MKIKKILEQVDSEILSKVLESFAEFYEKFSETPDCAGFSRMQTKVIKDYISKDGSEELVKNDDNQIRFFDFLENEHSKIIITRDDSKTFFTSFDGSKSVKY